MDSKKQTLESAVINQNVEDKNTLTDSAKDGKEVDSYLPVLPTLAKIGYLEVPGSIKGSSPSSGYKPPVYSIGDLTALSSNNPLSMKDFKILSLAGRGGFGKVYKATRITDGRVFALKTMRKERIIEMGQVQNVMNEKKILKICRDTKFIVHLLCTFQDDVHLFMVQEFLPGGSLLSYFKEHGHMSNEHSRFYAAEIFLGISYLHKNGIIYRDLKPDNILFEYTGHIKIVDLGFAKSIGMTGLTNTFCGTPSYLAPEVILKKSYGLEVDWWAYGIILFQLCCASSPFQEAKHISTFARILRCSIRWPPEPHLYFNDDVFDLISWLLELDPANRPFVDEIKTHAWLAPIDFDALSRRELAPPEKVRDQIRKNSVIADHTLTTSVKRILTGDLNVQIQTEEPLMSEARYTHSVPITCFDEF